MKKYILSIIFISLCFLSNLEAQTLKEIWSTEKVLGVPESAYYNKETGDIYISNIVGSPAAHDDNGYILLMDDKGEIKEHKWVMGLDAPKGITVIGNKLYVTDIDKVAVIDIKKAKLINKILVEGSVFLNDITHDNDGNLYVSDTRKNIIYKISGSKVEQWLNINDGMAGPNGMSVKNGNILIGTNNGIYEVDPKKKNPKLIVKHNELIDGLIPVENNQYIVSNWKGKVELIGKGESILLKDYSKDNIYAADLGYIPESKIILIPTFFDNRIIAVKIIY